MSLSRVPACGESDYERMTEEMSRSPGKGARFPRPGV